MPTWKEAGGRFSGLPYEASTCGLVRNTKTGKILKPFISTRGYLQVELGYTSKRVVCRVHQLVIETFVGDVPDGHEVNHKNGDKLDNSLENLEYVTHRENIIHCLETGLRDMPPEFQQLCNSRRLLSNEQAESARAEYQQTGTSERKLAKKYGVSRTVMRRIIKGETYKS